MSRVTLWVLASEAADAALLLASRGTFAPRPVDALPDDAMPGASAYREVFQEAEARLSKILEHYDASLRDVAAPTVPAASVAPSLTQLCEINEGLKTLWQECSATTQADERIEEEREHLRELQDTFARLESLDVDITPLLKVDALLDARLGLVPAGNVQRLQESLTLANYLLATLGPRGDPVFTLVAGPRGEDVGGVLSQAGWRELPVPEELRRLPVAVGARLAQESERLASAHAARQERIAAQFAQAGEFLQGARIQVALARPLAQASLQGVGERGALTALTGWVPRKALRELRRALEVRFQGRALLVASNPTHAQTRDTPSLLLYPGWLRPFVPLVKSYGIPRYGELDPAPMFALTYLLLFGAMFGDVGHGGVILLLAALFRRRLGRSAWIGIAAGAASMGFGLLYGSVFGVDDVLTPIWLAPLQDPIHILMVAILFGIGFIVTTLLASIWNKLAAGETAAALFDSSGLAGLLLYLGLALGLGASQTAGSGAWAWSVALIGALQVAAFKWRESPASLGERLLISVIETLETGIGLLANTLSFLRVAAFSLNHVALALAVFTLAHGLGTAGHGLTIVLGNMAIIVLEGGIVAIQALRLLYYEGFSRFFSGDGIEFVPLRIAGLSAECRV